MNMLQMKYVGLRSEVHDYLRFGNVIRLTNFPRNQNQARNDADYADNLRDVAPVLVFNVLDVRFENRGSA